MTEPSYFKQLREEVAEAFPHGTDTTVDLAKQVTMPYLNACM